MKVGDSDERAQVRRNCLEPKIVDNGTAEIETDTPKTPSSLFPLVTLSTPMSTKHQGRKFQTDKDIPQPRKGFFGSNKTEVI